MSVFQSREFLLLFWIFLTWEIFLTIICIQNQSVEIKNFKEICSFVCSLEGSFKKLT